MSKIIRINSFKNKIRYNEKFLYQLSYKGDNIALIYPNTYYVASSNLGFQTILKILNNIGYTVNRYFLEKKEVFSPDSGLPLSDYKFIFVSISYENDFFNLIKILKNQNIIIYSSERKSPRIIIGGAAVTINPFLYAYVADYVYPGEAELIKNIEDIFHKSLNSDNLRKNDLERVYNNRGYIYSKINKLMENSNFAHTIYLTNNTVFSNYYLLEITRGCLYNCYFCNYSTISHPYRIMDMKKVFELISTGLKYTNNIGLISAILPPYEFLNRIFEKFGNKINYHFSSLRVDSIDKNFFQLIKYFNMHSLTIAPESGNDRIRKRIGKKFTNEQIFNLILYALKNKINKFKFYFILGLEEDDEQYIIEFFKLLKKKIKTNINISISINPLIPKPMSVLGNKKYIKEEIYKNKIKKLRKIIFSTGNIKVEALSYREGLIQYVLSNYSKKIIPYIDDYIKSLNINTFIKNIKNLY